MLKTRRDLMIDCLLSPSLKVNKTVSTTDSDHIFFVTRKATQEDRRFGPAWLALGHAHAADNEHDQAIAAYCTAAQIIRKWVLLMSAVLMPSAVSLYCLSVFFLSSFSVHTFRCCTSVWSIAEAVIGSLPIVLCVMLLHSVPMTQPSFMNSELCASRSSSQSRIPQTFTLSFKSFLGRERPQERSVDSLIIYSFALLRERCLE